MQVQDLQAIFPWRWRDWSIHYATIRYNIETKDYQTFTKNRIHLNIFEYIWNNQKTDVNLDANIQL